MRVLGLISGTSFDGIDVACAAFEQDGDELALTTLGSTSVAYPEELHAVIATALPPAATTMEAVCRLDTEIGQAFAAVAQRGIDELAGGQVDLIVSTDRPSSTGSATTGGRAAPSSSASAPGSPRRRASRSSPTALARRRRGWTGCAPGQHSRRPAARRPRSSGGGAEPRRNLEHDRPRTGR